MRRLAAATLSLAWMAVFAALCGFALFAAEDGAGAAAASLGLPLSPEMIDGIASRPALAGFCLGAAIVSALFATVLVTSILNGEGDLRQVSFIADMGFGGAFGLSILAFLASFMHAAPEPEVASVALAGLLVASFLAMRATLTAPPAGDAASPSVVRLMALDAVANLNVVRFPTERTAGLR